VVGFGVYRKALKASGVEYLSEIEQKPLTGDCAKEIAKCPINTREQ
jgi:hypothetical protein